MLFILVSAPCLGQSTYESGALPTINFRYALNNGWNLNLRTQGRLRFESGIKDGPIIDSGSYLFTDAAFIVGKQVGVLNQVAIGYQWRISEDQLVHRTFQQFALISPPAQLRFAHRIMSDQFLGSAIKPRWRLRYRLTGIIALNGESIDLHEFYLRLNTEYISSVRSGQHRSEIRAVPLVGYVINTKNKLELGFDYRVNGIFASDKRYGYWLGMNWFVNL